MSANPTFAQAIFVTSFHHGVVFLAQGIQLQASKGSIK